MSIRAALEVVPARQADAERRKRLAALSFGEKLKILEMLRERSQAIAAAGLRNKKKK